MTHEQRKIRTVCMTCGQLLAGDADAPLVSHGYCQDCLEEVLRQLEHATVDDGEDDDGAALASDGGDDRT